MDLVKEAKFAEAVPVCTEALGLDPSNTAVQQALDKAKSEAASAAERSQRQRSASVAVGRQADFPFTLFAQRASEAEG